MISFYNSNDPSGQILTLDPVSTNGQVNLSEDESKNERINLFEIKTQRGGKKGETLWRDDRLFEDKEPVDSDSCFCSSFSIEWRNLRARSNSIYLPNGISIMWGYGRSGRLFDFQVRANNLWRLSPGRKKGTGKWISFALASSEIR